MFPFNVIAALKVFKQHSISRALMIKTWKNAFLELLFLVAPKFDNFNCESCDDLGMSSASDRVILKSQNKISQVFYSRMKRKFTAILNFFQVVLLERGIERWSRESTKALLLAAGFKLSVSCSEHRPWTKPSFLKDTQAGAQWRESSFFFLVPVPSLPLDDTQCYAFHDTSHWSGSGNAVTALFCRWGNYRADRLCKAFSVITSNLSLSCKMPNLLVWLQCQPNGQLHDEQRHCKPLGKEKWCPVICSAFCSSH